MVAQEGHCRFETSLGYIARPRFKEGKRGGEGEGKEEDYFCSFTSHNLSSKIPGQHPRWLRETRNNTVDRVIIRLSLRALLFPRVNFHIMN